MYTIACWYTNSEGKRVREIVNPDWRMPFHWADEQAGRLNQQYRGDRIYVAVNVNEISR